jgi:molecular chaperone DnaK
VNVRKGEKDGSIRIPVMEGQSPRADRNRLISTLIISAGQIKRDVPAGSEVEVTIDIDRSRLVQTRAFIPLLDEEYENVISMGADDTKFDPIALNQELQKEKERLAAVREKAQATGDEHAREALQKIEQEQMVEQADAALAAASDDADDAKKIRNRLLDLRKAIDSTEDSLEWPALVLEAEKIISAGKEIAQQHGNAEEKRILQSEEAQVRSAIQAHDPELLAHQIESYRMAIFRILDRTGILQVIFFQNLSDRKAEMRDQAQAQQLISEGLRAMNTNDKDRLQAINHQLAELLPTPPKQPGISDVI